MLHVRWRDFRVFNGDPNKLLETGIGVLIVLSSLVKHLIVSHWHADRSMPSAVEEHNLNRFSLIMFSHYAMQGLSDIVFVLKPSWGHVNGFNYPEFRNDFELLYGFRFLLLGE